MLLVTVKSLVVLELLTMELDSAVVGVLVVTVCKLLVLVTLEEVDSVVAGVLVLTVELVLGYKVD